MNQWNMHAATDVGRRRKHNEDCVNIKPEHGIAILADGMGGYNAGEVASAMAVEKINEMVTNRITSMSTAQIDEASGFTCESILVRDAIREANNAIYESAQKDRNCKGMGTTVLVALLYADRITAAHVGDSRMYRLRDGELTHVTEDHSLIHEQVRRGLVTADDARNSTIKNLVTRALGIEPGVDPDLVEEMVYANDLYLLSSDGLTDVVSDEVIRDTMAEYGSDLAVTGEKLIALANDAGGPDNISVILIRIAPSKKQSSPAKKGGLFSRLLGR